MVIDDLRTTFLTGGLSDEQLAEMVAAGEEASFEPDTELFHEGAPADYLWILLEGSVQLTRQSGNDTLMLSMPKAMSPARMPVICEVPPR